MSGMAEGAMEGHHSHGGRLGNPHAIDLATFIAGSPDSQVEVSERVMTENFPDPDEAIARRKLVLSEDMVGGRMRFLINGKEFDPHRIDFECVAGSTEIWEIVNEADMDHPFHLHVFPFLLLSRNGVPEAIRMWRDTVNLAEGDHVKLLVPFTHFRGTVMYHCHIVEHEDLGMMGLFDVV